MVADWGHFAGERCCCGTRDKEMAAGCEQYAGYTPCSNNADRAGSSAHGNVPVDKVFTVYTLHNSMFKNLSWVGSPFD